MRRAGREKGAISLEQVGLVILAGVLCAAVVAALTQSTPLGPTLSRAVCSITGGDCDSQSGDGGGSASTTAGTCTVGNGRTVASTTASAVTTLSDGRTVRVDELSDGSARVSPTSLDPGSEVSEVGLGNGMTVRMSDEQSGSASVEVPGLADGAGSAEYVVTDADQLRAVASGLETQQVKDELVGRDNPVRSAADGTRIGDQLPEAEATYTPGGFSVSAQEEALGEGSGAGGLSTTALGIRTQGNGTQTFYIGSRVDGPEDLELLGVSPSGAGDSSDPLDLVTAVTFDPQGNMVDVTSTAATDSADSPTADAVFGHSASGGSGPRVHSARLATESERQSAAAADFLGAQGVSSLGSWTNPSGSSSRDDEPGAFFDEARDSGSLTTLDYEAEPETPHADTDAGQWMTEAGLPVGERASDATLSGAAYWDGSSMAPWTGCHGGGA